MACRDVDLKVVQALAEKYDLTVAKDFSWLILADFEYPAGWHPQQSELMLIVPEGYRRQQPRAYVPEHLYFNNGQYTQRDVSHKLPSNYDGWCGWCIDKFPWNPREHDLIEFLRRVMASFSKPWRERPFVSIEEAAAVYDW